MRDVPKSGKTETHHNKSVNERQGIETQSASEFAMGFLNLFKATILHAPRSKE